MRKKVRLFQREPLAPSAAGDQEQYPHLKEALGKPINWELIRQQYDQMIKYATALRIGTADADAILRRFTRSNVQHPTYQGLCELGILTGGAPLQPTSTATTVRIRNGSMLITDGPFVETKDAKIIWSNLLGICPIIPSTPETPETLETVKQ